MKILFTIFDINNFGGIVADLELKCKGLRELGHEVSLLLLRASDSGFKTKKSQSASGPVGSYPSEFGKGIIANTDFGWYNCKTLGYSSKKGIETWKRISAKFDGIFHEIPNPPVKNESKELDVNRYWAQLYEIETPQIIIAHDAHYREMYPYIHQISANIKGISCTNHAGYVGLSWLDIPRAFVGAPHPILDWESQPSWKERKPYGVAAHMWKAWKHQDFIIRAIPKMESSKMYMAGDGIERRYLTSETKCPKEFTGIWDAAVESKKFKFLGMITPDKLFDLYQKSRLMVDMSFSKKFNALGNHFNRSIIEGWNNGVVALCVDSNMRENNPQVELFKKDETHFEVPSNVTPQELAEAIDHCTHISARRSGEMIEHGRSILMKHFHYKRCAADFLKLLKGKSAGIYPNLETGKINSSIVAASEAVLSGEPQARVAKIIRDYNKTKSKKANLFK